MKRYFLFFLLFFTFEIAFCQSLHLSSLYEVNRRNQLTGQFDEKYSFSLRPIFFQNTFDFGINSESITSGENESQIFDIYPLLSNNLYNQDRPYGWGYGISHPNVGFQNYLSGGVHFRHKFINVSLQPEINFSENRPFSGYPDNFARSINVARFRYWNTGDFPETFHDHAYLSFWYGQSKVSLIHESIELGVSTQNLWWGPGQFNSLVFSNNAKGFPHLSLNTVKPVSTFLGNFEGQVLIGRLENSLRQPTQSEQLNNEYFRNFNGDWRYLNGFTVTYNPKWITGMFLGLSRAYHQYNNDMSGHLREYFPIFDPFQKDSFGFERDGEGRDQIASVFMRYVVPNAKSEFYFEFGRRDHSLNWREFLLNPEHARAYLLGFTHLVNLSGMKPMLQFRGEITHQQESVNRYIRYPGLGGNITWHTHWNARGFVNYGQALGVGSGVGSNVQTLEVAFVEKFNKLGIMMERLANHQDFYFRAFGQQIEHKPWVDLSLGLLFNYQWERFLVDSRLQFIHANNYQWQLKPDSELNFPVGMQKFSIFGQLKLLYLMNLDQLRK